MITEKTQIQIQRQIQIQLQLQIQENVTRVWILNSQLHHRRNNRKRYQPMITEKTQIQIKTNKIIVTNTGKCY